MTKKISSVFMLAAFSLLLLTQVNIANATNLTIGTERVESLVEITDIVEKEWLKSVDSAQFDPLNSRDFNAQKDFLWSPDGSKLLILTQTYIKTKNASADDKKLFTRCSPGPFGIPERVSGLFLINADGSELTNIVRTETSIRTAKNNTTSFIDSAESVEWSSDSDKIVLRVTNPCDDYSNSLHVLNRNGSTLSENKNHAGFTQWNPDRSKIAILDKDRTRIYLTDLENSTVKQIPLGISVGYYHIAYSIAWSPDGEKIAFIGSKDGEIYTVNIHNSSVRQLTTTMAARGLSWKPDGKKVVFVAEDGLYVMDADGSNPTLIGKGNFYFGSWSPDGRKIVLTDFNEKENSYKSYILVFNEVTTKLISPASGSGRFLVVVSWSLDGRKIIFRETDGRYFDELYVFDIDGETTNQIVSASDSKVFNHISLSPNGDRIAFTSYDSRSVYTVKLDGTDKVTLAERDSAGIEGIYGWGSDNKLYSFTDDALIKVNPDGTERLPLVKNLPTNVYSYNRLSLSPDGSRILFTVGSLEVSERKRHYLLKMKGYDEVMSIYAPCSIKQGDAAFIEVKFMSKPIENAVVFLNGREIGKTNESGFLKYSFKEAGNLRLSAAKQGFRTANKSITVQESPSEQSSPEPTFTATPQITKPATAAATLTPKAPGFASALAIAILSAIYLFKRRYN